VCEAVKHNINLVSSLLDEFVFVKYFKPPNFKLLNGQLFVSHWSDAVILSV